MPEHYCDFLIALYSKGDEDGQEVEVKVLNQYYIKKKEDIQMEVLISILRIIAISMDILMQIINYGTAVYLVQLWLLFAFTGYAILNQ